MAERPKVMWPITRRWRVIARGNPTVEQQRRTNPERPATDGESSDRDTLASDVPQQATVREVATSGEGRPKVQVGQVLTTTQLAAFRATIMLGPAGTGKSHEIDNVLAAPSGGVAPAVCKVRLAMLAPPASNLRTELERVRTSKSKPILHLDSLDEAMARDRAAPGVFSQWIREVPEADLPVLRVASRGPAFQPEVQKAVLDMYGPDAVIVTIVPLTDDDVAHAAQSEGIPPSDFWRKVVDQGLETLAEHPLTLGLLFQIWKKHKGALPSTRGEVFRTGVGLLAEDQSERDKLGSNLDRQLAKGDLLDVAERLACFMMLTGKDTCAVEDVGLEGMLQRSELEAFAFAGPSLDRKALGTLALTGLCDGQPDDTFRFMHKQIAEYLAGRRIADMPAHRAKALLASPLGDKEGVAAPLRETAAFAAMENEEIARWLCEADPEVVALSDVANDDLRRKAALSLLEQARLHKITDSQVGRDLGSLKRLKYRDAEDDLRPILKDRSLGTEDVLELAIDMAKQWELSGLSDLLADLTLDDAAPSHPRVAAGYALFKIGTSETRARLKPLIKDACTSKAEEELKGVALRCNWPDQMSTPHLLAVLHPTLAPMFFGAYQGFQSELDKTGFSAEDDLLEGLKWARRCIRHFDDGDPLGRIAMRIAHAAVQRTDDTTILAELATLLVAKALHSDSPLRAIRSRSWHSEEQVEDAPAPLLVQPHLRRPLLDAIARVPFKPDGLSFLLMSRTPGLSSLDDFGWLLGKAADTCLPEDVRRRYAALARWMPWQENAKCVDLWLARHQVDTIAEFFPGSLCVNLASSEAAQERREWRRFQRLSQQAQPKPLDSPPKERVLQCLDACESNDARYFYHLCCEVTLEATSTHYGWTRFITSSPGWAEADDSTKARIVRAAQRLLVIDVPIEGNDGDSDLSTIKVGPMAAFFLLQEIQPSWLNVQGPDWWGRWTWHILSQFHRSMANEPDAAKQDLFRCLHATVPGRVHAHILQLATGAKAAKGSDDQKALLLSDLLSYAAESDGVALSRLLLDAVERGEVAEWAWQLVLGWAATFDSDRSLKVCETAMRAAVSEQTPALAKAACVVTLCRLLPEGAEAAVGFLEEHPDLAACVLKRFTNPRYLAGREDGGFGADAASLSGRQLGRLAVILMEAFPPSKDPDRSSGGAYFCGPDDYAQELRTEVITHLSNRGEKEAVEETRRLENRYAAEYPWFRRVRARAERAYRLARWEPFPLETIARSLRQSDDRLYRTEADMVDGIEHALRRFEAALRGDSGTTFPFRLSDLWNTPRDQSPSPKSEKEISQKLADAIRGYFERSSITANREVEVYRRTGTVAQGGQSSSNVDILVQQPATHAGRLGPLKVCIEVKRSCNNEAKTGLVDQLASRYMPQIGATVGVYVVVWLDAPNAAGFSHSHRPQWATIDDARTDLDAQAKQMRETHGFDIRVVIVDASFRPAPA
ncbi:MAG: hypothetical protein KJZ65_00455 [Phycisphaerales bacterium]|nr:hypothetical protein [Phycisphaerales bacterium]